MPRISLSIEARKLFKQLQNLGKSTVVTFPQLVNQAAGMVVEDIKHGVAKGEDIKGKPFKPLTKSTVASKSKQGMPQPTSPLIGTGRMSGAFLMAGTGPYIKDKASKTNNYTATVTAPTKRAPYGIYQQEGTKPYKIVPKKANSLVFEGVGGTVFTQEVNHPGLPKREWFGVSKDVERRIQKMMQREIDRRLSKKYG